MKKLTLFCFLLILSAGVNAQDTITKRNFFYSFSWTPTYYGPNDGKYRLDVIIPLVFEANVYSNLKNRTIILSGLGIQQLRQMYVDGVYIENAPIKSEKMQRIILRIPIQVNYKLTKDYKKIMPYVKTEFVNEFGFLKSRIYSDGIYINTNNSTFYSNSVNIGYGALSNISKPIRLLTEISMGTYILSGPFDAFHIKLKIGILI